jgi:hypothetical protein
MSKVWKSKPTIEGAGVRIVPGDSGLWAAIVLPFEVKLQNAIMRITS